VTNADGVSVTITGYTNGEPSVLVIPPSTNGLTVTAIGENALANFCDLVAVTIPASVTNLEEGGFTGSGLTSVTIPYSLTNIGGGAFADCGGLTHRS
jgi:hypothetical protein